MASALSSQIRANVNAIENVPLSQHGFMLRSPQRKQPGGRRELRIACISPHLTAEALDKTAMTSLRLLGVLDV